MKESKQIYILISFSLIFSGLIIFYNVIHSPPINPKPVSYISESSSKAESQVTDTAVTTTKATTEISADVTASPFPIDLNSAGIEELMLIPGVGNVTASNIFEYRVTYGRFYSVDELEKISGISKAKIEKIRPYITLS